MTRWKRCGLQIIIYKNDHKPRHVHVFEDGKPMIRFDTDNWVILTGKLTPKAKKALELLRKEGKI